MVIVMVAVPEKAPLAEYEAPPAPSKEKPMDGARHSHLNEMLDKILNEHAACEYVSPDSLGRPCEADSYELDGDVATMEVGDAATCPQTTCNLWLVQINAAQIQHNRARAGVPDKRGPVQATEIGRWQAVTFPVTIRAGRRDGWGRLKIRHTDGKVTQWPY